MTNQASEDKLDEILFNLCDLSYASFTTQEEADRVADQLDYDRDEAKQAIQSIIRTEKLKLLAEVRERVIGEHKPKTRGLTQNPNNAAYWTKASKAEFDLIEQQLNKLAKLEAEL